MSHALSVPGLQGSVTAKNTEQLHLHSKLLSSVNGTLTGCPWELKFKVCSPESKSQVCSMVMAQSRSPDEIKPPQHSLKKAQSSSSELVRLWIRCLIARWQQLYKYGLRISSQGQGCWKLWPRAHIPQEAS